MQHVVSSKECYSYIIYLAKLLQSPRHKIHVTNQNELHIICTVPTITIWCYQLLSKIRNLPNAPPPKNACIKPISVQTISVYCCINAFSLTGRGQKDKLAFPRITKPISLGFSLFTKPLFLGAEPLSLGSRSLYRYHL